MQEENIISYKTTYLGMTLTSLSLLVVIPLLLDALLYPAFYWYLGIGANFLVGHAAYISKHYPLRFGSPFTWGSAQAIHIMGMPSTFISDVDQLVAHQTLFVTQKKLIVIGCPAHRRFKLFREVISLVVLSRGGHCAFEDSESYYMYLSDRI